MCICISTDFRDVFLLALTEDGVVLFPSSASHLLEVESGSEAEAATIEDLARAVAAAERELNADPSQWRGLCLDGDNDILRFENCTVSAACKQGNRGVRIVLWGIMGNP